MRLKNNRAFLAIIFLLFIVLIGTTFAYFQSSTNFINEFNYGIYDVYTTEVFESPDNWKPGEEIPKTITTKNEGTIDAAVRVSYTEKWEDSEGNDITNSIDEGTAIINLDNTNEWTKEGNYYYYNYILKPNDETSSFIKSVTLNPNLNGVSCTPSNDGLAQTCEASNPVLGATYKLTITKETVQYDQYQNVWNTNIEIIEKPPLIQIMNSERTKDTLQVGDEICINGYTTECFNFIGYDGNNVKLLSKYNLKVGKIFDSNRSQIGIYSSSDTGYGLQSSEARGIVEGQTRYGTVAFSATNYWYDGGSNLKSKYGSAWKTNNVYDTDYVTEPDFSGSGFNTVGYSIAYYVEEHKNKLEDYGITINNARLLTYAEATDSSIGCNGNINKNYCPRNGFIANTSFWLGSAPGYVNVQYVTTNDAFHYTSYYFDYEYGVRPVIVISKSDI